MFLFMVADVGAPIDHTVPVVEVVVETPATYNGNPINVSPGVTLTMTDGFTVTMSSEDAEVAAYETEDAEVAAYETDEEYSLRLCRLYSEAKPWLDVSCGQ